jgi:hypothetical protein
MNTVDYQLLRDTIDADSQALALATAGDRSGCAARVSSILPETITETYITERTIFDIFSADATLGEEFMQALEGVAAGDPSATPPRPSNPIVARALKWMQPNNGGVNVGNIAVRNMIDSFASAGLITQSMADAVKSVAEQPATVTPEDIERAGY